MATVSGKVPGQVAEVLVRDNEVVTGGRIIVRLDARDYRARVEQGRAAVVIGERRYQAAVARVGLGREMASSQVSQARAASMGAEAARASAVSALESARALAPSPPSAPPPPTARRRRPP